MELSGGQERQNKDEERGRERESTHVPFNSSSNDITPLKCTFHLHLHRCSSSTLHEFLRTCAPLWTNHRKATVFLKEIHAELEVTNDERKMGQKLSSKQAIFIHILSDIDLILRQCSRIPMGKCDMHEKSACHKFCEEHLIRCKWNCEWCKF